jgi:hypothetical protein
MTRFVIACIASATWVFLCALNVAHGTSIPVGGLEISAGLFLIGGWLGGAILNKSLRELHGLIRAGQLPRMPPFAGNLQILAVVVALVSLLDLFF